MARFQNVTGKKSKYNQTEPVYGTVGKEIVDAGLDSGDFVLMERVTHAKVNGRFVESLDRRFFPKGEVAKKEKGEWRVVHMSVSERASAAPSPAKVKKQAD